MPTCSYCKRTYHAHKGLTVFTFDARTIFYCSSKCRRNSALGRDSKKLNWIKKRKENILLEDAKSIKENSDEKKEDKTKKS